MVLISAKVTNEALLLIGAASSSRNNFNWHRTDYLNGPYGQGKALAKAK